MRIYVGIRTLLRPQKQHLPLPMSHHCQQVHVLRYQIVRPKGNDPNLLTDDDLLSEQWLVNCLMVALWQPACSQPFSHSVSLAWQ